MPALSQAPEEGTLYPVFIDTTTAITAATPPAASAATWKAIMCLTSNAINVTVNGQDITSKCTGGWADSLPGVGSWSVTADGQLIMLQTADKTTKQSGSELLEIVTQKKSFWVAIFDPQKKTYRVGVAWISQYNETHANNSPSTFSITLTGRGQVYQEPKTAV